MAKVAIGMIETRGLIASIEAMDNCLKAADVKLLSRRYSTGGLVCVTVCGDVGSVHAAVEAGVKAASKVGKVIAVNVIPNVSEDVLKLITREEKQNNKITPDNQKPIFENGSKIEAVTRKLMEYVRENDLESIIILDDRMINDYSINRLRKICRILYSGKYDNREIMRMTKADIIRLITEYFAREEGSCNDKN